MAGVAAAWSLARQGVAVTTFDLGRAKPGGRASSRAIVAPKLQFDHGAQFVLANNGAVKALVKELCLKGSMAEWSGSFSCYNAATRSMAELCPPAMGTAGESGFFGMLQAQHVYVAIPTMDTLCTALLTSSPLITTKNNTKVHEMQYLVEPAAGRWRLSSPEGAGDLGVFSGVVLSDSLVGKPGSPGHIQVRGSAALDALMARLGGLPRLPLFSLMLGWERGAGPTMKCDAASMVHSPHFSFISHDSAKPGRGGRSDLDCYVAITTPHFAAQLLGDTQTHPSEVNSSGSAQFSPPGPLPPQTPAYLEERARIMFECLSRETGPLFGLSSLPAPSFMRAHRWGAALPAAPLQESCLEVPEVGVVACGDFCGGGGCSGVEAALLSGMAAAKAIVQTLD